MELARTFSSETHPFDEVRWVHSDVVLKDWRTGEVSFEQRGVEFPDFWQPNAIQIVTSKYFRGALGTESRESSLKELISRVVGRYRSSGTLCGYFGTKDEANIFADELTWLLLHQYASFNSPVWFNVGTDGPQQVSACFLLSVDDSMDSILNWYREEGLIFKGGSGSGVNLSRIRGSNELLSSGGSASGPVSFMRGADASAGTIKSGGATRRAAKMVILDIDHPDIEEFIETKLREEEKIRVLRDAGFDMDLGGKDSYSVQYQNANNSVRVTDEFMKAVVEDADFTLKPRTASGTPRVVSAKKLWQRLCHAAWACADPGVQYHDTINSWHTSPSAGAITTSNPCAEYLHLDNSSCNLASINLLSFLDQRDRFETEMFEAAVQILTIAMDISICFADFPTPKIADVSRSYRQLGLGYANLGALLMSLGIPYDSLDGVNLAAEITSLMSATAYRTSALLAKELRAYEGYACNELAHLEIVKRHRDSRPTGRAAKEEGSYYLDTTVSDRNWDEALALGQEYGFRNAQLTLLAPTGTCGLAMGVDTTGVEPALGLVTTKKLVSGETMTFELNCVRRGLESLGYEGQELVRIAEHIRSTGTVVGAPSMQPDHYAVFDCALSVGDRGISPIGHVRMMAAVQPFLSGGISKTVNLPASATEEDVSYIYTEGWMRGLKALAIYRDGCKVGQPLSITAASARENTSDKHGREKLPLQRESTTRSFTVGGSKGYLTASRYPDGRLGEIFLRMSKQGSTLAGIMDAFSIAISIGLQYGVPLKAYVEKFRNVRFEPSGITNDEELRFALSIVDYLFRRLALDFLSAPERADLGIASISERIAAEIQEIEEREPIVEGSAATLSLAATASDAPICLECGVTMERAGTCFVCRQCGSTSGCS